MEATLLFLGIRAVGLFNCNDIALVLFNSNY